MTNLQRATLLAVAAPMLLLAGAYASEALGLVACDMCWWQRWAHFAALATAIPAALLQLRQVRDLAPHDRVDAATRFWTQVAALAILTSGLIGAFHAGVEYGWWEGHTACTATTHGTASGADLLSEMMRQPLVRCDRAQWTLFGISSAGYNALLSTVIAVVIASLSLRRSGEDVSI